MLGGRKAGDEIIDGFSTAIGMPSDCRSYALHKFCIDTTGNMVLAESEPFSRRKLFIHIELFQKIVRSECDFPEYLKLTI